jgi:hypothetical protein
MNVITSITPGAVPHVIKGEVITGADADYGRFRTPALNLNDLVWPRSAPPPAADVPVAEILDIMVALGDWLTRDPAGAVEQAFLASRPLSTLEPGLLERSYHQLGALFNRDWMQFSIDQELGGTEVLDGWREVVTPSGRIVRSRAFPPRLIHVVAGNAAGVTALTVLRGAISKGVHLIKLPSNDLFTAAAILQGLSAVAPGHPTARSFSAAYWRGGDRAVESMLFRPVYFDKLVAWGGEATIRSAKEYIGPGFELVAFDPKTSISLIGREVHETPEVREDVADRAAADVTVMDQQACTSSRFQFVEGTTAQVDEYCAALHRHMAVERPFASACGRPLEGTMREEIDALRDLAPDYRVFGNASGSGIVIRSSEPVDFHPDGRVVNVVQVARLEDAINQAHVATQTVGIYPPARQRALRDALAARGVQRVVAIGRAPNVEIGLPHDGFLPFQRYMRWVNDED